MDYSKIREKMDSFNKRWNISEDGNYQEELNKFKIRVLNSFRNIDNYITKEGVSLFCNYLGVNEVWSGGYSFNISSALKQVTNELELYKIIELIFILPFKFESTRQNLIEAFKRDLEFSNINLSVSVTKDFEVILFQKGEKILDDALVDKSLSFLTDQSLVHFVDALKSYQSSTKKSYVKSAESVRRAVEEYLRKKLKNKSGLKENTLNLTKKLKDLKGDPQIRNIITQNFNYLDTYFNENSKHNDGDISEKENEFLIYQAALLMNYIESAIS